MKHLASPRLASPRLASPRLALLIALALPAAAAAACSGFSSEETPAPDAGVMIADATANEDTGSIADSAPGDSGPQRTTWESAEAIRSTTQNRIVLRLGSVAGDYYYSEAAFFSGSTMFHGTFTRDAGSLLTFEGGTIQGEFPSMVAGAAGASAGALFFNDSTGAILGMSVNGSAVAAAPTAFPRGEDGGADGGPRYYYNPYALPLLVGGRTSIYSLSNNGIVRAELMFGTQALLNESAVTIVPETAGPTPKSPQFPVVSRDETTLYFAAAEAGNANSIWVATRLSDPIDANVGDPWVFGDAHRVFPDSTANEFPTDLSADGKTLYFTRIEASGATAYRVRQKP